MAALRGVALRFGVAAPRAAVAGARLQARPAALQSQFTGTTCGLKSLCSSFAGMTLVAERRAGTPGRRASLLVVANAKNSIANTLRGSRLTRTRTSGFRARMQSPNGRKVLARRRRRGRKQLCPAHKYKKP